MTGQRVPEDRYGSRARTRTRPWLRRLLAGLVVLGFGAAAVIGFNNLGSKPIEGKQSAFQILGDDSVRITVELQRQEPQRPAECVVRARAESGEEIGRREVLIPPSEETVRQETTLRTAYRATIGEVYGCTYNVPEYLSNPRGPTG